MKISQIEFFNELNTNNLTILSGILFDLKFAISFIYTDQSVAGLIICSHLKCNIKIITHHIWVRITHICLI